MNNTPSGRCCSGCGGVPLGTPAGDLAGFGPCARRRVRTNLEVGRVVSPSRPTSGRQGSALRIMWDRKKRRNPNAGAGPPNKTSVGKRRFAVVVTASCCQRKASPVELLEPSELFTELQAFFEKNSALKSRGAVQGAERERAGWWRHSTLRE